MLLLALGGVLGNVQSLIISVCFRFLNMNLVCTTYCTTYCTANCASSQLRYKPAIYSGLIVQYVNSLYE